MVTIVVVVFVAVGVVSHMIMLVMMMMMCFLAVVMREHGVGNEMQESVAKEASGSEAQQHLEEARMLMGILQGYVKQDEERGGADEQR